MARGNRPISESPGRRIPAHQRRNWDEEPQPQIEVVVNEEMADAETTTGGNRSDDGEWDEESEYSADAAYHARYVDDDFTPLRNEDNDWIQGPRTPPGLQEYLDSLTPEQRQMRMTLDVAGTPPSYPPVREEGVPEVRTP